MDQRETLAMARRIAEDVAAAGGRTYFVGGCVRDRLLGRENQDLDLEVHGILPEQLAAILDNLGERTEMGRSFGIFGLKHYDLDIAMPCAGGNWEPFLGAEAAARRRDLTINAMMEDVLTGEVLDFFGGKAHLEQGLLRHVDGETFREDPLRVFRTARFAARFAFSVDAETMALAAELDLSELPRERVFGELQRVLLEARKPSVFFGVLRQMDCLSHWFPEVENLIGVEQDPIHHPEGDVWNHTMAVLDQAASLRSQAQQPLRLMMAALCHDFGKVDATQIENGRIRALGHEAAGLPLTETFLTRLTGEKRLLRDVQNLVEFHMRPNILAAQGAKAKAMCSLFDRVCSPEELLLLARADHFGKDHADDYEAAAQFLQEALELFRARMAEPYVMGSDLIAAGYTPGPVLGEALDYAHKLRLAGVEKPAALKQTLAWLRKNTTAEK